MTHCTPGIAPGRPSGGAARLCRDNDNGEATEAQSPALPLPVELLLLLLLLLLAGLAGSCGPKAVLLLCPARSEPAAAAGAAAAAGVLDLPQPPRCRRPDQQVIPACCCRSLQLAKRLPGAAPG